MSIDPSLLIRRWPERRAVVLTAAGAGFAAVFAATWAVDDPAAGLGLLNLVPVVLLALEFGLAGGLAVAALGLVLLLGADLGGTETLGPLGIATRALALFAAGAIAGRFSDRMRAAHARQRRLLDSVFALCDGNDLEHIPGIVAAAAVKTPRVTGASVQIAGAPSAHAGRREGEQAMIALSGHGRLELRHRGAIDREDLAALELLALQAGLAADNQRLQGHEREAAALEQELLRVRDELLEQRSGIGRLLEAEESGRRRTAEKLQEDLAQVLAAVLVGLRMLRRNGHDRSPVSLDELHEQVVGVLEEVRTVAASLSPPSLEQLGLIPALEALARDLRCELTVAADGAVDELTDPLRTGVYRVIEQLAGACPAGAPARVRVAVHADAVTVGLVLPSDQPVDAVRAARARVAMLGGTLDVIPAIDDLTRIRFRLPLQEPRERSTGSDAQTLVPDGPDSIAG